MGELLRVEREHKGLTIKDVEAATSVRALYLTAIEEGNYKVVPAEVYLKGFIRSYANFLGLNPQEMVDLYRQEQNPVPSIAEPSPPASFQPVKQDQSARTTTTATPTNSTKSTPMQSSSSAGKWIAIAAILAVVAGAGWWFMSDRSPTAPAPNPPLTAQQTKPNSPTSPNPTVQTPVPNQPAQKKPVMVSARYVGESWTLVTADGKDIYEGIPKLNETLNWQADRTMTVKVGNAAGVELTYNGQPVGKIGEQGEVVIRTFAANANEKPQ